jgi:MYXO-CTERM domain-containing protein
MFKFEVISAVSAVPEPSTWAWGLMALGTIGLTRPRRRLARHEQRGICLSQDAKSCS